MIVDARETADFWCPMTRIYNPMDKASGYNAVVEMDEKGRPDTTLNPVAYCRGEKCMMWRYTSDEISDRDGYCGLAGTPNF
jgi:hypothetical protein